MKSLLPFLAFVILLASSCAGNSDPAIEVKKDEMNRELKRQLEAILAKDQGIRALLDNGISPERKAEIRADLELSQADVEGGNLYAQMDKIDSTNLVAIEGIFRTHGYPSKSLVGEPANEAGFYVIQHSDKIDEYLPLLREAANAGDIEKTSLAMMEDRNLMRNGLPQMYGSQVRGEATANGEWRFFLWPVQNRDSINSWRMKVGFEQTVQAYLLEQDVDTTFFTMEEIKKF